MSYPAEFKSKLMKGFTSILLRASAFYPGSSFLLQREIHVVSVSMK